MVTPTPFAPGQTAAAPAAMSAETSGRATPGVLRDDDVLRFLLTAGDALASSLDYETTLSAVVRQAVPLLADWCALDLLDENGALRRLAVAHPDPAKVALAHELQLKYPEDPKSPHGTYARLRDRVPVLMSDIPDSLLVETARDAEHLRIVRELGLRSFIAVPLIARDDVLGSLTLVAAESNRRYTAADVRVAEELARRAALAIDHARLYREAVNFAAQLEQQALELELQTQQLQDQAAEMEAQQSELEMQTEEIEAANEELRASNDALVAAYGATSRAEEYLRGIMTSIADPLVVYDTDWRCQFANESATAVFRLGGVTDSFVGNVLWDVFPDLVGTDFERQLRRAAAAREPVIFTEHRAATSSWAEVRCSPLAGGGVVVLWRNITAQRRAEETLHYLSRASEILVSSLDYETTINQLAQLVVPRLADWCTVHLVDESGRLRQLAVAHVDPEKIAWARELSQRYPPNPNAPTGAPNVIRSGKPELVTDISDEMLAAAATDAEHLRILRELGFTAALIVPIQARNHVLGAMTLVSAESQRRYTEAELALAQELANRAGIAVDNASLYRQAITARDAAEEANAAKSAFLAKMSHELRTPLNAIDGYAQLLELGVRGPLNQEQLVDIARVRRSQRHLLSLINDVLNYAKIEAGRVQYEIRPVALGAVLEELESLIEPLLREHDHRYSVRIDDPGPSVLADDEKLQQILLNLLSNAIKFTTPGGAIHVSAVADGHDVVVQVEDSGIGIPSEKLDAVFEPFVQLQTLGTKSREGTGLGLAISRDLARGMGGDLTVSSTIGVGSTFALRLPRSISGPC